MLWNWASCDGGIYFGSQMTSQPASQPVEEWKQCWYPIVFQQKVYQMAITYANQIPNGGAHQPTGKCYHCSLVEIMRCQKSNMDTFMQYQVWENKKCPTHVWNGLTVNDLDCECMYLYKIRGDCFSRELQLPW